VETKGAIFIGHAYVRIHAKGASVNGERAGLDGASEELRLCHIKQTLDISALSVKFTYLFSVISFYR
jgi:hypothetical protein